MAKFSIIVPCHRAEYLDECIQSVLKQTFTDWELILVPNGGLKIPTIPLDSRIRVVEGQFLPPAIGMIKKFAFSQGTGDYLVELDSDDLLLPNTLSRVSDAISSHPADFYYSNDVYFEQTAPETGIKAPIPFNEEFGWRHRPFIYKGRILNETVAFKMSPSILAHINSAPDHIRIWKREFYERVGGHDEHLKILDDLDLMCRTYLEGTWYHIDMPLYMYRLADNSWAKMQEERFKTDHVIRERYLDKMMRKWAKDKGYAICENLSEFNKCEGNIGYLKLWEQLHKVDDKNWTIKNIYSKMAPGGYMVSRTIHGLSDGYIGDPTSKSQWNLRTFEYWTDKKRSNSVDSTVRWRAIRGYEFVMENNPALKYVDWMGYALKGGVEEEEGAGWRGI